MRILYDNGTNADSPMVQEVECVDIVMGYENKTPSDDIPTHITLSIDNEYVGELIYDNESVESYNKALADYRKIANQLLVHGYCRTSEFNVRWF